MKILPIVLTLIAGHAAQCVAGPLASPWYPPEPGNYFQVLLSETGQNRVLQAVVMTGRVLTAGGTLELPVDPASGPFNTLFVRGDACESYTLNLRGGVWYAAPRNRGTVKPECQIKRLPERWMMVEGR